MNRTLPRLGIIGAGWIAQRAYAPALATCGAFAPTVVYDPELDRAQALAARFARCHAATEAGAVFSAGIDALLLCSPPSEHLQAILTAHAQRIPVLCEKPVVRSAREAVRILQAEATLMGSASMRFRSDVADLLAFVHAGRLGTVRRVQARWTRHRGVPSPGSWRTQAAISPTGVLEDLGPHLLDLVACALPSASAQASVLSAQLVCRSGVREVGGNWFSAGISAGYDAPDHCSAELQLGDGPRLQLELSWCAPTAGDEVCMRFEGDAGSASFEGLWGYSRERRHALQRCSLASASTRVERDYPADPREQDRAFARSLAHFARFCQGEAPAMSNAREVALTACWMELIQRAALRVGAA